MNATEKTWAKYILLYAGRGSASEASLSYSSMCYVVFMESGFCVHPSGKKNKKFTVFWYYFSFFFFYFKHVVGFFLLENAFLLDLDFTGAGVNQE